MPQRIHPVVLILAFVAVWTYPVKKFLEKALAKGIPLTKVNIRCISILALPVAALLALTFMESDRLLHGNVLVGTTLGLGAVMVHLVRRRFRERLRGATLPVRTPRLWQVFFLVLLFPVFVVALAYPAKLALEQGGSPDNSTVLLWNLLIGAAVAMLVSLIALHFTARQESQRLGESVTLVDPSASETGTFE